MPKPTSLPYPPLRNHQFMCLAFMDMLTVDGTALERPGAPATPNALVTNSGFLTRPSAVSQRQIEA